MIDHQNSSAESARLTDDLEVTIQRALLDDEYFGMRAEDQDVLEEMARGSAVMLAEAIRPLMNAPAQGAVEPTDLPDGWEYQKDTNSVVCGGCAFRYGAEHSDADGSWTCPNCGNGNGAAQPPAAPVETGFVGSKKMHAAIKSGCDAVNHSSAVTAGAAIRNYLKLWDSCGGSTAVAAGSFADARQMMRDAIANEPQAAQEIERLRLALSFYADGRRYQGPNQRPIPDDHFAKPNAVYINDVTRDNGSIAARALSRPQLGDGK